MPSSEPTGTSSDPAATSSESAATSSDPAATSSEPAATSSEQVGIFFETAGTSGEQVGIFFETAGTSGEQADTSTDGNTTIRPLRLTSEQKKYIKRGKSRRKKYCKFSRYPFESIMLPPVPNQTRIDVYPDELEKEVVRNSKLKGPKAQGKEKMSKQKAKERSPDPKIPAKIRDEIIQRDQYEGEVIIYRALEELEEKLICLHSFAYTAHQFKIWRCNLLEKL